MKHLALVFVLLAGCSSTLPDIKGKVDKASSDVRAAVKSLRSEVEPYAQAAAEMCSKVPVDPKACVELSKIENELFRAFSDATKALDAFDAGKGDFAAAFKAGGDVLKIAKDYAKSVSDLLDKKHAAQDADAGVVGA